MIAHIPQASKVMLKTLQARLQQYVKHELSDVQAGFNKSRGARDKITKICLGSDCHNKIPCTGCFKVSFSFQSQRKAMPKNAQTTAQLHSSHMLEK